MTQLLRRYTIHLPNCVLVDFNSYMNEHHVPSNIVTDDLLNNVVLISLVSKTHFIPIPNGQV